MEDAALKEQVRAYWEADPCGAERAQAPEGTPEFFRQVEAARSDLEPFIGDFADLQGSAGKTMLEIGCGLGTDLVRFARAGARITGVDLTEHAVELTRKRLELEGLAGEVRVADAEALPFSDDTFERVYSWGVLHHTPDTAKAIREAVRVLEPGGELIVMLYARRSWVAWGFWVRHALIKGRPWRSVASVLADHMESQGTKAYTVKELRALFPPLDGLTIEHVGTPYDRSFAPGIARFTGRRLGWFLVIRGRKPAHPPA